MNKAALVILMVGVVLTLFSRSRDMETVGLAFMLIGVGGLLT